MATEVAMPGKSVDYSFDCTARKGYPLRDAINS
jgi:hypothetical protein